MIKCKSELTLLDPQKTQNSRLAKYMRNRGTMLSSRYGDQSLLASSERWKNDVDQIQRHTQSADIRNLPKAKSSDFWKKKVNNKTMKTIPVVKDK